MAGTVLKKRFCLGQTRISQIFKAIHTKHSFLIRIICEIRVHLNHTKNDDEMKILNVHKRLIQQPKAKVAELMSTLATQNDKVWPLEKWPPIRFKNGLVVGSKGGHGPIGYEVAKIEHGKSIHFHFIKPKGFVGFHRFDISSINENQTEIKHTIDMTTNFKASLMWLLAIRWLHDALIDDAFDKVENHFSENKKQSKWSFWVVFLRKILK